ncbi:MAG TPA: iron ABC transporter permease [Candidatus Mucispirillum faecigallinarum]|uniref:Iron ABC transporter permease n=1 Tax=Candidatus Mucispirillum faecigallinarum TaxID=2838699 RepID=A0A9D2GWV1_9BACT|nr:iron ABC transporter permease [Candidatus Mucispirillum faecigallinarum]
MIKSSNKYMILLSFFMLLIAAVIISLFSGKYAVSLNDGFIWLKAFFSGNVYDDKISNISTILFQIRLPRILGAVIIGAALGVSGAMLQSVFANPLVSPGIMGVLSGASFGAAFGIITFSSWVLVQISTLVFGIAALLLALFIAFIYKSTSSIMLILGGMISGAFFNAMLSIVKLAADPNNDELASIVFWLMGSLALIDNGSILVKAGIPLVILLIISLFFGKILNILAMSDDEAKSLGLNTGYYKIIVLLISSFLASLTVVMAGNIGWVGLIIPHIARMIIGPDNRYLLILSALLGGIFLLICDSVVRNLFQYEVPLGIITSLIGLIVFVIVLKNNGKGWR